MISKHTLEVPAIATKKNDPQLETPQTTRRIFPRCRQKKMGTKKSLCFPRWSMTWQFPLSWSSCPCAFGVFFKKPGGILSKGELGEGAPNMEDI